MSKKTTQVPLKPVEYYDERGIHRRVLVPADDSIEPHEGIPVSLDVEALYGHMPDSFIRTLTDALWSRGLIEAKDFIQPGALEQARSALLSAAKHDALDMQTLAIKELRS